MLSSQILNQLKHKSPMTSTELFNKSNYASRQSIAATLYDLAKKKLVTKEKVFNPTSGKWPWNYTITAKGKRYLYLRTQLKALLHERD